MSAFVLDTSSYVEHPKGSLDVSAIYWDDLSPFAQGYVEGICQSFPCYNAKTGEHEAWPFRRLAPETLARIIEDCAKLQLWDPDTIEAGRLLWEKRQAGLYPQTFPPLTVFLGDDGKVRLK